MTQNNEPNIIKAMFGFLIIWKKKKHESSWMINLMNCLLVIIMIYIIRWEFEPSTLRKEVDVLIVELYSCYLMNFDKKFYCLMVLLVEDLVVLWVGNCMINKINYPSALIL